MRLNVIPILLGFLERLRLWPLSLAEKCRLAFGIAVVFTLIIALLLPYIWMGQLVQKSLLDSNKAKALAVLSRLHFQLKDSGESALPALNAAGTVMDVNNPELRWIRFAKNGQEKLTHLTEEQKETIETLKKEQDGDDIILTKEDETLQSTYIKIFRATDICVSCHNPQGSAGAFTLNEPIGAVLIQSQDIGRETIFLNLLSVIVAGLVGGTGAIVAFYIITQRVILRPIRQLRGLATNVAEGNLDIRSSIQTRDEYEKLADAFNNMLDNLQAAQEKLRQANIQLDAKIAELSQRNIELFKANKVKDEFLANMSHEFRTPLNAILGFAQVLREKPHLLTEDRAKKYAENIVTSGNRLLNMINDLLDLAKTQAGKMELHIEQISLDQLCRAALAAFSLETRQKRIKIKLLLDDNVPHLVTDAGKVQQILYNFLSNAVKFTPEHGRIEVRAQMLDERNVRISVTDTGCGIADADKEKIFEKFHQLGSPLTRSSPGTGLGLAISRELTPMIGGTIGFESQLTHGSTFWLDIPITLAKEQPSP